MMDFSPRISIHQPIRSHNLQHSLQPFLSRAVSGFPWEGFAGGEPVGGDGLAAGEGSDDPADNGGIGVAVATDLDGAEDGFAIIFEIPAGGPDAERDGVLGGDFRTISDFAGDLDRGGGAEPWRWVASFYSQTF